MRKPTWFLFGVLTGQWATIRSRVLRVRRYVHDSEVMLYDPHEGSAWYATLGACQRESSSNSKCTLSVCRCDLSRQREVEPRARWIQRYAYRRVVVPVAVAKRVAVSLKSLYGVQDCRVIANGIPTDGYANPRISRNEWRAKEGFRESDILFVCVARFAPQKNHALLLNAFAQGPASNPNAHLVLVGEGVLQAELEAQAKRLKLTRQVHFLGLRADVPDVLGAMDIFVLSSDWEGNPLSILEAMAAGLPIVSTAVGGVPDLFENGQ